MYESIYVNLNDKRLSFPEDMCKCLLRDVPHAKRCSDIMGHGYSIHDYIKAGYSVDECRRIGFPKLDTGQGCKQAGFDLERCIKDGIVKTKEDSTEAGYPVEDWNKCLAREPAVVQEAAPSH